MQELERLRDFVFERVLNDDPVSHTTSLLGTLPSPIIGTRAPAIIRMERTAFSSKAFEQLSQLLEDVRLIESTDIYSWFRGWVKRDAEVPDIKLNVIFPATDVHVRKYSKQAICMVQETPELYNRIVKPYITSFPAARTQWVENILTGVSESEKILHRDESPTLGYVILPDMKWDLTNTSTLYLVAIALDRSIRSLRDLRKHHIPMLRDIKVHASKAAKERWGVPSGGLRFYVHYQPSYYHFHVHIVNANYVGLPGMAAGQAHILEDIISLLELSPDDGPTVLEHMTFTYGLGDQHGLYNALQAASLALDSPAV